MDQVLERINILQSRLAAIDLATECDVADKVASIAVALRSVLVAVDDAALKAPPLRAAARRAAG